MLNWLNRALVVVVLLVVIVAGLAIALAPGPVAGGMRQLASALEQPAFTAEWLVLLVAALAVAGLAFVLLVLELRVRGPDTVALAGDPAARLSALTIVQRLRTDVEALEQVDQARDRLIPRGVASCVSHRRSPPDGSRRRTRRARPHGRSRRTPGRRRSSSCR